MSWECRFGFRPRDLRLRPTCCGLGNRFQSHQTRSSQPFPLFAIQQLRCPKCRARMKLARTSPGPTGFELKRFDCSECDHAEQIAIPSDDPVKSDAVGWFTGELQPPK